MPKKFDFNTKNSIIDTQSHKIPKEKKMRKKS